MMSPKEKANELVEMFKPHSAVVYNTSGVSIYHAKQCALIAVEEIVTELSDNWMNAPNADKLLEFWNEVKQEIEKL